MGFTPSSVTPFCILNDKEIQIKVYLGKDFWEFPGIIEIHPNDNNATVRLKSEDLVNIISEYENKMELFKFDLFDNFFNSKYLISIILFYL